MVEEVFDVVEECDLVGYDVRVDLALPPPAFLGPEPGRRSRHR